MASSAPVSGPGVPGESTNPARPRRAPGRPARAPVGRPSPGRRPRSSAGRRAARAAPRPPSRGRPPRRARTRSSPTAADPRSSRPPAVATSSTPIATPAATPTSPPIAPRIPASTSTPRQTWRRLIPAARSIPSSRTRSQVSIESVLTMPSAATTTAASASRSSSPNTRSSASATAPSTRAMGAAVRASCPARARDRGRGGRTPGRVVADGDRVGAQDAEAVEGVGPADEHALAGPTGERPLDDPRDPELHGPGRPATARVSPSPRPSRSARERGRITAPPVVERREGVGPVADGEREPPVGGEVGAADGGRLEPRPPEREVERGDRRRARTPSIAATSSSTPPSPTGAGAIAVRISSPGPPRPARRWR